MAGIQSDFLNNIRVKQGQAPVAGQGHLIQILAIADSGVEVRFADGEIGKTRGRRASDLAIDVHPNC